MLLLPFKKVKFRNLNHRTLPFRSEFLLYTPSSKCLKGQCNIFPAQKPALPQINYRPKPRSKIHTSHYPQGLTTRKYNNPAFNLSFKPPNSILHTFLQSNQTCTFNFFTSQKSQFTKKASHQHLLTSLIFFLALEFSLQHKDTKKYPRKQNKN